MNVIARTEILGNIASGKTTIAGMFCDSLSVCIENFHANPFYAAFYSNPELNAFEAELTFTLQHYHQIKSSAISEKDSLICDFSLWLDAAYSEVTLTRNRLEIYRVVHKELISEIGLPKYVIHLECPSNEILKRIHDRGRKHEQSINIDYLEGIRAAIQDQLIILAKHGVEIITIDSNAIDFANEQEGISQVKEILATCGLKVTEFKS